MSCSHPFIRLRMEKRINPPDSFTIELPCLEAIPSLVQIKASDGSLLFQGLVEEYELAREAEGGLKLKLKGRDLSANLFHRLTGSQAWLETKVRSVVEELLEGVEDLTLGGVEEPFPVWHRWKLEGEGFASNGAFNNTTLIDGKVALEEGAIEGEYVTAKIAPTNWIRWLKLLSERVLNGGNLTFDLMQPNTGEDYYHGDHGVGEWPGLLNVSGKKVGVRSGNLKFSSVPWYRACKSVAFTLRKTGNPSGRIWAEVWDANGSQPRFLERSIDELDPETLEEGVTYFFDHVFNFEGKMPFKGKVYFVLACSGSFDSSNYVAIKGSASIATSSYESYVEYEPSQGWRETSGRGTDYDIYLYVDSVALADIDVDEYNLTGLSLNSLRVKAKLNRPSAEEPSPQLSTLSITHESDYVNFTVDYESRFEALKRLAAMVGGEFWVDAEGKLYFMRERGQDKSASILLEKGVNLLSLERRVDMVKLANRIRVIGAGQGAGRIEVLEEDFDSQLAYGLREAVKIDKEIDDEDSAKTLAQNLLTLHAKPREVVVASLSRLPKGLDVGDRIAVKDQGLGIDGTFRVKRLEYEYDADRGETVTLELGSTLPELSEELLRVRDLERWLK
ncbi:MAG: phage tail protein [Candidatus Hecatellaceae archaeon]